MGKLLGTPYKRGNSDVILAFDKPETLVEEGLAILQTGRTTLAKFAGTGTPAGVMGGTEHKACSAVMQGLEVYVQIPTAVTTIAAGAAVYVDSNGKFTNVATDNTAINATFVDGVISADGIVQTGSSARVNQKCALINFAGGF